MIEGGPDRGPHWLVDVIIACFDAPSVNSNRLGVTKALTAESGPGRFLAPKSTVNAQGQGGVAQLVRATES